MAKYKLASAANKTEGEPHSDWQLNYSYYQRFPWPEHHLAWHEGIPTVATFRTTAMQTYSWPGGSREVEIALTTQLCFHEPQESFKKQAIALAKAMDINIQEPKKHVYFAQDRFKDD